AVKHAPQHAGYAERLEAYRAIAGETNAPPTAPANEAPTTTSVPTLAAHTTSTIVDWSKRLADLDWDELSDRLTRAGCVLINGLVDGATCAQLRILFEHDAHFAKTVVMDRADFGQGTYRYFRAPIPDAVTQLRQAVYPHVAVVANAWQRLLGESERFALEWKAFESECHRAGQTTPTPILLKYGPGGFNALHRDLRGTVFFPIQMAVVLSARWSEPDAHGFRGGEFLFCDVPEGKKARQRTIAAGLGDAVLFCTRDRLVPVGGAYGLQPVKHGVTRITAGERFVLGVPFHEYR